MDAATIIRRANSLLAQLEGRDPAIGLSHEAASDNWDRACRNLARCAAVMGEAIDRANAVIASLEGFWAALAEGRLPGTQALQQFRDAVQQGITVVAQLDGRIPVAGQWYPEAIEESTYTGAILARSCAEKALTCGDRNFAERYEYLAATHLAIALDDWQQPDKVALDAMLRAPLVGI